MTPTTNIRTGAVKLPRRVGSAAEAGDHPPAHRWAIVIGTWLLVAALVALVQLGRRSPSAYLDELVFGRVAENIGNGEGRTFQGLLSSMSSVYPYVIAPAWALLDGTAAYRLALAFNALLMTSVVLPAYGMAATVAPFRRALIAGVCAALVPAMVWSGMLMTEALAYPVAAWALFAMVRALHRPTLLRTALVAVLIAAACLVRTQLIALGGIFIAAVALDIVRGGRAQLAERARRHRVVLIAAAAGALAFAALLLVGQRSFGTYSCVVADAPSPREIATPLSHYVGTIFVATLGLPLIALIALALRRSNWADDRLAPLLAVGLGAVVALVVEASWTAVTVSPELQERYVFYAAPVLVALVTVLPERARPRDVAWVAVAATAYAVAIFPGFADLTGEVVANRLGLPHALGSVLGERAVLWGVIFAALGAAAWVAVRVGGQRGVAIALAVTAAFGAATFGVRQIDANRSSREALAALPHPADVIDRTTGGQPAGIVVGRSVSTAALFGLQMWNTHADRTFRVGIADAYGAGQLCPLKVLRDGTITLPQPCAGRPLPRFLVFLASRSPLNLANGVVRYEGQGVRLVEYRTGEVPRLKLRDAAEAEELANLEAPPRDPNAPLKRCTAQ